MFSCDLSEVGPFGEPTPDHAVVVLVAPFFPGGVAMAVIDVKPLAAVDGAAQLFILHELAAVVCGDALEDLPEVRQLPLQAVEYLPDR